MHSLTTLAAALFVGNAAGQLVIRSSSVTSGGRLVNNGPQDDYQRLLQSYPFAPESIASHSSNKDLPPYKAGQFTLTPQDNSTCATYGEDQWTGTVDVTDDHRLFFWFFESRGDPENDPIVLWMNGGPGASSLLGLFQESGPCTIEPGAEETIPNEWSWNRNASVLYLDQPAGVGFSTVKDGGKLPSRDIDGAQDFQTFLNIFFSEIFPEKAHLPIHIAAESYGGHYGPIYVDHILRSRAMDARTAFRGNISSIILIDSLLEWTGTHMGMYELLCSDYRGRGIINDTACAAMAAKAPECERLGRVCEMAYDGFECWATMLYCEEYMAGAYNDQVDAGKRSPYDIRLGCPYPPMCDTPNKGNFTALLNTERVKEALHFPPSFVYDEFDGGLNTRYSNSRDPYAPTTRQLAAILDADPSAPLLGLDKQGVRVLVLNGREDFIINFPGQRYTVDNLRWSGQADYRIAKWKDLAEEEDVAPAKGEWKGLKGGKLVFMGVDGAGHMVPGDQPEASWKVLQRWLDGGWTG